MLFSSVILSTLASALFVSAAPTPAGENVARACKTAYPSSISHFGQNFPDYNFGGFVVGQDNGGSGKIKSVVQFSVPAGSYGCQLQASFPAGAYIANLGTPNDRLVNVFSLTPPVSAAPTWNTAPTKGPLVGTITFKSSATENTLNTINSFGCAATMPYLFEISSSSTGSSFVSFDNNAHQGLIMTYNC